MIHHEGRPLSDSINGPITEAEIALLKVRLDNIDLEHERRDRLSAAEALDPETVAYAARILTKVTKENRAPGENSKAGNETNPF
jgi:hypothetical protein